MNKKVKIYRTSIFENGIVDYTTNVDSFVEEQTFIGAFRDENYKSIMITKNADGQFVGRRFFQDYTAIESENGRPIVVTTVHAQLDGVVVSDSMKEWIERALRIVEVAKGNGEDIEASKFLGDMPIEMKMTNIYGFDDESYEHLESLHEKDLECPLRYAIKIDRMTKEAENRMGQSERVR